MRKMIQKNELKMFSLYIAHFPPQSCVLPIALPPPSARIPPETGLGSCLHLSFRFGLDAHDCIIIFSLNKVALNITILITELSGPP